ncbi:MAG: PQQ-binding-like beta-propeller repeat protein [Kiritimatiellae bacterium]|nr:PQQ-binding-like beta-propeller repeat protein [Kiritimatiellia bacterium]
MNLIRCVLACWCVASAVNALAQEVRWGGKASPNCVSSATNLPDNLEAAPLWSQKLGTHQYSIPTVDRGLIFVGSNDSGCTREGYQVNGGSLLSCLEQRSGALLWSFPVPRFLEGTKPPYFFNQWRSGFISAPLVVGDRVFLVGSRGDVLCFDRAGQADGNHPPRLDEVEYMQLHGEHRELNAQDGDLIWQFNMLTELGVSPHDSCGSTILYVDGLLYVNSSNGVDGDHLRANRPDAPTLFVLESKSGKLVAVDDEKIARNILHGSWSSPSYGEAGGKKIIFFGGGDGFMYAFEAVQPNQDGKLQKLKKIWAADCNPPHFRERDGVKLEYSAWNTRVTTGPSEPIGTPVFMDGKVYIAIGQSPLHGLGEGCMTCFDAATGEVLWRNEELNRTLATLTISKGVVYVADLAGDLHAFEQRDGKKLWSANLGGPVQYANVCVADGKLFIGTERNQFWIFEEGREKKVLSVTKLPSAPITAVVDDGVLYIPMQNRLNAYGG